MCCESKREVSTLKDTMQKHLEKQAFNIHSDNNGASLVFVPEMYRGGELIIVHPKMKEVNP
jgi:hypothetical protein